MAETDSAEEQRHRFHRWALEQPYLWHHRGSDLLIAAENLVRRATCLDPTSGRYDPRVLGPGLMLRGLGIENLLKGLFVMRGGKLGTGKRSGDMPCKHHDLPKMAELAAAGDGQRPRDESLRPTAEEQPMIYALHGCLQFAGRYPIPRDPKNVILHTNTTFDDRVAWSRARESLFESFLRRLAVGFYGGSESDFSGEGEDPDRQARRAAMRQSMDVWVCWPFIETGGCVGDGPLAHWAVASLSLAWDVRIQL